MSVVLHAASVSPLAMEGWLQLLYLIPCMQPNVACSDEPIRIGSRPELACCTYHSRGGFRSSKQSFGVKKFCPKDQSMQCLRYLRTLAVRASGL